ncbi:aminoacyl-tRNA deacylase [Anaeromicropila populeti]|uniref:Aminoacyl-tRNA editing domain-containing protein n=1 Tax=Anaeromicropila populeti TaxID=37658 RepID=A0A1I6IM15_9FIRM|nr:YbaK/EbsC family protein [Anaeromicropila populeti]SFR67701.1 Aminoacyl-tRNA editing domain-containing protein [Anaeromicropila populeti]
MKEELIVLLDNETCDYEIIKHKQPILTLEDAKKYFEMEKTAAILILKSKDLYYGYIKCGVGKTDLKELAERLHCEKLKLASSSEVKKVTGYDIGYVPLVGLDILYVMDKEMTRWDYLYGGIGEEHESIKINVKDFLRIHKNVHII